MEVEANIQRVQLRLKVSTLPCAYRHIWPSKQFLNSWVQIVLKRHFFSFLEPGFIIH